MQKTSVLMPGPEGRWGSYVSKFPPDSGRIQPNMFTAGTRDLVTAISGQADKRTGGTLYNPSAQLSGPALDQYEGIFLSQVRLLIVNDAGMIKTSSGNGLFPIATNGTGFTNPSNFEFATLQSRVYGDNGIDNPIVIDTVTSYGGVTYPVNQARVTQMGAFAPASAPIVVRNTDSTANQVPAGAHTYKITFVYYNGVEESNGGPASTPVTNDATHTSNTLSSIPIGGYGVTARNIYRDNNDQNWLLLATILDNTTTTYLDILTIGATPTPIPTTHGTPPIFKFVAAYLDRLFVIDVTGKNIAWSLAGEPDVFDPANVIAGPQDDILTAIFVFNGIPWIFGQHTVGTIQGSTDSTFFYHPVSVTVGCADNRSIQVRTIVSTPTLIWLSATPSKGLYYSNGYAVQYLSEFIEDLLAGIVQGSSQSGRNIQNSLAAWQSDTSTPGIDLLSNPGTVQTIDPDVEYQSLTDWLTGTLSNIATVGDQLQVPINFAPTLASGTLGGDAAIVSGNVTLPSSGPFTGETVGGTSVVLPYGSASTNAECNGLAQPFIPPKNGTLTNVTFKAILSSQHSPWEFRIWNDSFGVPGTVLFAQTISSSTSLTTYSVNPNLALTAGVKYYFGFFGPFVGGTFTHTTTTQLGTSSWSGGHMKCIGPGSFNVWTNASYDSTGSNGPPADYPSIAGSYTFTSTPTADTGTWTSPTFDSQCTTQTSGMEVDIAGTYPVNTSSSVQIQGSANGSSWTTTDTLASPNGTVALTGGQFRYWRIIITVSTTDNTTVPTVGPPTLEFATTGTWTSPAILCTTDITALSSLTDVATVPGGTSIVLTIATSADNITYSSFGPIGSATPQKYAKIRATLTTTVDNDVTPTLTQLELDWSVTSTITSTIIDTGQVPVGWGVFQFARVGMGGTIQFAFRTASTAGGIPGATFVNLSNGQIPTNTVNEFCQWRATLTAAADSVPAFNSVTVNWLISAGSNLRAASLFFNKSYYLELASPGATHNDTLIELDYEGNFRIHRENIATMGLFFGDAYEGDSTVGNIFNMFKLPTDNGVPITFDLRTKCYNWATPQMGDNIHLKVIRACKLKGVNTGTLLHMYYSVDRGANWIEMFNSGGTLGYQTDVSGAQFVEYFIPNFDGSVQISAPNLMFRVVSADAFPCSILTIEPVVYVRKGKFIKEEAATWP